MKQRSLSKLSINSWSSSIYNFYAISDAEPEILVNFYSINNDNLLTRVAASLPSYTPG